jgi:RES domain-containing protein
VPEFEPAELARIEPSSSSGTAYRNQAPGFDPTSGEGARRLGGRFNPPRSFPVVTLCASRPCVVAELMHLATRQGVDVADLLPRELWAIELDLDRVLDLSEAAVRRRLQLDIGDLIRPDHGLTREIGEAAHDQRLQAIRSPSAAGVDEILAVFTENLAGATLKASLETRWTDSTDLPAPGN